LVLISKDTIDTVKVNGAQYKRIVEGKDLVADILPPPAYALEANLVSYQMIDAMDANDKATLERLTAKAKTLRDDFDARAKFWSESLESGELKATLESDVFKPGARYFAIRDEHFLPAVAAGDKAKARDVMRTELLPAYELHRVGVDKSVVLATARAQSDEKTTDAMLSRRNSLFMTVALLVLLISTLSGFGVSHTIVKPLERMVEGIKKIAETNDLTVHVDADSKDEMGDAGRSFNGLVSKLRAMMVEARRVADFVSSGSREVSSNAEGISAGAQDQAASLEETAASLEEITSTVKQNSDNAQHASQLATRSRDVAESGGSVVDDAITAMREISESSAKIADITSTIDEIAFQTNILALNAAVEAARAGEHGRGFAVVAAEVRSLAGRSASAAKEIKTLIADSAKRVNQGAAHVNKSGETLKEIVVSVKRVTDMVAEIAAASQEQTIGVTQVNKAVSQVDHVTQGNAARTEEMSATAESLATQAEQLQQLVARFRVDGGQTAANEVDAAPISTRRLTEKRASAKSEVVAVAKRHDAPRKTGTGGFEEF
jgi:methyl-accepting chemotaxis protein